MNDSRRPYLKWAWRYGHLNVKQCDDLDGAVRSAMFASDEGYESFAYIEAPDGSIVPDAEVKRIWRAEDDKASAAYKEQPQPTHRFMLAAPVQESGELRRSAAIDWAYTDDEATAKHEQLIAVYGDRVKVERVPR